MCHVKYIYIAHSAGLVVISPVMEELVAKLIPIRSISTILTGKLEAQLPECDTNTAMKSQYFEYNKT